MFGAKQFWLLELVVRIKKILSTLSVTRDKMSKVTLPQNKRSDVLPQTNNLSESNVSKLKSPLLCWAPLTFCAQHLKPRLQHKHEVFRLATCSPAYHRIYYHWRHNESHWCPESSWGI